MANRHRFNGCLLDADKVDADKDANIQKDFEAIGGCQTIFINKKKIYLIQVPQTIHAGWMFDDMILYYESKGYIIGNFEVWM